MSTKIKICGVKRHSEVEAVHDAGGDMIGLVFYPPSPRYVDVMHAASLCRDLPTSLKVVGLFVDPDDQYLDEVCSQVPLDMVQLHGSETPDRIGDVKADYPLPVIKALGIRDANDVEKVKEYRHRADIILLDAKPPKNVTQMLPGGNGIAFDWQLLKDADIAGDWMLSGGLDADNVTEAMRQTRAPMVDVSSGVEDAPGRKSIQKIREFITAVRSAEF